MENLIDMITQEGADLVGFADLQEFPPELRHNLPYGISVAVKLDRAITATLDNGPTPAYEAEYNRLNEKLDSITGAIVTYLEQRGHDAFAAVATMKVLNKNLSTPLPHKTVAVKAGLGWIGKSALLITPEYGGAVRLSTVLTDMNLESAAEPLGNRCHDCTNCVDTCPGEAPSGTVFKPGMNREDFFSAVKCREVTARWRKERNLDHNICGICIAICPWTQKYLQREGF